MCGTVLNMPPTASSPASDLSRALAAAGTSEALMSDLAVAVGSDPSVAAEQWAGVRAHHLDLNPEEGWLLLYAVVDNAFVRYEFRQSGSMTFTCPLSRVVSVTDQADQAGRSVKIELDAQRHVASTETITRLNEDEQGQFELSQGVVVTDRTAYVLAAPSTAGAAAQNALVQFSLTLRRSLRAVR